MISTRQTFQGDLTGFLIGNLQGVSAADIVMSAVVAVVSLVVLAAIHKELVLVSFDRTLAPRSAIRSGCWTRCCSLS